MSIRGHFDGRVVVLDEPTALRPNQRVTVSPEPDASNHTYGTLGSVLANQSGRLSDTDAREMIAAIELGCEHIDLEPTVEL